ncbi:hypothetical protein CRE_13605 [Caenorhabditis remanei]|uniref:HMG box domain-containing protein n=1 Tax=Caenorhabditis remanei TaxID=31234 RepID=E3N1H0_CAERE|nr:hypothetical protein CRE_13605 [Caenorhabditis remanei]
MAIENSGKGTTENANNLTAVLSNHNPKSNDRHKKNHKRGIEPVRLFCKERRREFRKMYPEANTTEITKQMSIAWKNLSEVEKQPFQTKYMRLKAEMKSNPPESSMTSLDAELLPPPVTSGRSTPKYLDAYQSDHSELPGPTSLVVTPPFNYFSRLSSPIESLWTPPSESISTDYYRTTSFSCEPHSIPSSESRDYSSLEPFLDFSYEDNKSEIPDDLKDIHITLPMIPEWEKILSQF